jgi:membrane fusion protein (multidrug efflux system)
MNDIQPSDPPAKSVAVKPAGRKSPLGRALRLVILGLLLLVGGYYGWQQYRFSRHYESTDDAFINRHITQISARVGGPIVKLYVRDNQQVKAGDLLAEVDPADYQQAMDRAQAEVDAAVARLRSAKATLEMTRVTSEAALAVANEQLNAMRAQQAEAGSNLQAAEAERDKDQADLKRLRDMAANLVSRQQLDAALAAAKATEAAVAAANKHRTSMAAQVAEARARVESAQAALTQVQVAEAKVQQNAAEVERARTGLRQAKLNLSYTRITAPEDGYVSKKAVEQGAYSQAGQTILALVSRDVWVVANFKETQLDRIRVGQPVDVHVDAFPDEIYHGHVESIQPGTGARFSLLPPENATGNYVKVVQRVPVKILFDSMPTDHFLAAGMSVEPDVKVQ